MTERQQLCPRRRDHWLRLALGLWAAAGLVPGEAVAQTAASGTVVARRLPPLEVHINLDEVDLARGQLTLRMSRPAAKVTLKALGISGAVLAEAEQSFDAAPAGSPLVVQWSPPEGEQVARIEVFGYDTSDYYKGVAITPWSFEIPHEDVVFETDSAEIRPSEVNKLQASLALIQKQLPRAKHLGTVTLFVVAHTDTVATAEYNQELSARRAQSLARWFRTHGLKLPIAYAGMGERALKIKTEDNVDEARNRRADYMLGVEAPRFKSSGLVPSWKQI
jgi:outer membrane protein OmpA-like peptidoglycan-associated protein